MAEANWRAIDHSRRLPIGTLADVVIDGESYRATLTDEGRRLAWKIEPGQEIVGLTALYEPVAFRVISLGVSPTHHDRDTASESTGGTSLSGAGTRHR
jgi:hypothetical protein